MDGREEVRDERAYEGQPTAQKGGMTVYEIIKKLLGEIRPIGETNADNERFENLKSMIDLIYVLLADINEIIPHKDRVEYSLQRAGKYADEFLNKLGIEK